jgi:hypothetical protein
MAANRRAQQRRFDQFRHKYNYQRRMKRSPFLV